jgi:hypothetical protein
MRTCHHCHATVDPTMTIGTSTLCPSCGKPLHSCFNCRFYRPGIYHDCSEGVEEFIEDKKGPNYCDAFMLGECGSETEKRKAAAKAKAEALFG